MRNARAFWLVTDASDWPGDGADERMDVTELGEQLDAPRTPRAEREDHDVSHVPHRHGEGFGETDS